MRRSGWLSLAFGTLVGTLVIVLLATVVTAPSNANRGDCIRLVASSSTEKGDLIHELAERYNNTGRTFDGGRCAKVEAFKKTSGAALDLLAEGWNDIDAQQPEPQVWLPSSSLWLDLLRQRGKGGLIEDGPKTSLATSPMVIAMPEPMARQLGWPDKGVGWRDVLELNRNGGWAAKGLQYAQWGNFTLGKDNPRRSTSGLAATIATYFAATGGDYGKIGTADAVQFVRGIEASVAYYSDDSVAFLKTLYEEDQKPTPYISAMAMQEQMVYLYNHGAPTGDPKQLRDKPVSLNRPLVAVHPSEGTMLIDHPFLTTAKATPDQRAAAKDFSAFLRETEQQDRFRDLGFRDPEGRSNPQLAQGAHTAETGESRRIEIPTGEQIQKMLDGWEYTQRRGRILLVLDLSGSMNEPFDKTRKDKPYSERRIDLLKPAIKKQLDYLHPEDQVGLWTFSTNGYEEKVPIGKVKDVRRSMTTLVENLKPDGDTALYKSVVDANAKMRREFDPNVINAVVVLTDGVNTEEGTTKEQMLQAIDAERLDNSVRVFTMAYGAQADSRVLDEIAQKSKARGYKAVDPQGIDKMFVNVFSNF
ncbi:substrate-binding and vWA domain-containing protein [Amycolatopsis orientalis]|uniref:substrate-binding and vWA domain-containing protein n=1 Tax=Amycolatopsis orientalis TaxID=31958 RepID=UPI0003FB4C33|nr:substrate-binding and VWA domain-containing protein [Amycolatopsis orientalis]